MKITLITLGIFLHSCAVLHKVAIADIDNTYKAGTPIDIKFSEIGVNLKEGAQIIDAFRGKGSEEAQKFAAILSLFQWGPRVGNIVLNENYDTSLMEILYQQCPSGKITELMSVREMRKYPVISGEIIRVRGWCAHE